MPNFEKDANVTVDVNISVKEFLNECDSDDITNIYNWMVDQKHFPEDTDEELNDSLMKISDARLQLTNEDTEELKRIAGKYR